MMNPYPLVSICIPTFNRENFIWRAIESAIHQTYKNIEIVVVDNASTDNTREVVLKYAARDKRIKYFENATNIGSGNNYLKCAEYATGEYTQALGSDDWLSRNYVEEGIQRMSANPEAAAIMTNVVTIELRKNGSFRFISENSTRPGRYSADWFFRNALDHPHLASKGYLSLMRREDFVRSLRTELKRPTSLIQREGGMPEPIDGIVFWGVLVNYEHFMITNDSAYIAGANVKGSVGMQGGFAEREDGYIHYALALRHCYESFCDRLEKMKKYQKRIHISLGLSILIDTFSRCFKKKVGFGKWGGIIRAMRSDFFSDYSLKNKLLISATLPLYFLLRTTKSFVRFFRKRTAFVPTENHFLTKDLLFKI
ncbi:MAG: glycosyltransferase family 2 protein [bacterium]|nr:glycosyltransferase family 2 protein [bacterium]